jgi:folate-binding protein YgfZ
MRADLSDRAKFLVSGPDAQRYLNGQLTNDVAGLRIGDTCYALVCNHKGKLEADVCVSVSADGFRLDADGSLREALEARLGKYIVADDCQISDITDEWALFHELPGSPERGPDPHAAAGGNAGAPVATATAEPTTPGSHTFMNFRFGVAGRDLWLPAGSPLPEATASREWLDLRRIERGIPVWGSELTPDVLPQEAGLESRAIDFNKGCYIGQEVISRIKSVGHVNRRLVPLIAVENGDWLQPGHALFADDPPVAAGTVTSARFHPSLQKSIALGYVKRTFAAVGARFHAGPDESGLAGQVEVRSLAP